MSNAANTHPDKHSKDLESSLELDLSLEKVDLISPELMFPDQDLTLEEITPDEDVLERLPETTTPLSLAMDSVPFAPCQGRRPFEIANTMAQAINLENLYQITVTELRKQFAIDRALIYQFQSAAHGTVIAESLTTGYRPVLGQALAALAFGLPNTDSYKQQAIVSVPDIADAATTPYQMQLYQHIQVQANLSLPIFLEDQLWGLLVIQACATPRQWTHQEIALFYQVGTELTLKLQVHTLQQQRQQEVTRERLLTSLTDTIRNSAEIQQVFDSTTRTLRHYLTTDRVAIFQFHPETNHGSGTIIAENVSADVVSAQDVQVNDHCFGGKMAEAYRQGRFWAAADIYEQVLPPCHTEILAQFQVRANLVVPLLKADQLWGLVCIHHCVGPRQWTNTEITFVQRVAAQLNVALQQVDYLEQVNEKNQQLEQIALQEQLITKITERLRKTTDLSKTLQITVRDIRHMLKADRVGLFQFDMATNYSVGEFVVEDVAPGILSAKATQVQDHCFAEDQAENYRQGRYWVVDDISTLDLPDCLVELLSQLQVRASLVVPLLKGNILWGLFCVHQCSSSRQWQKPEIEFVHRIGAQLNLALQQADYLEQVNEKNQQLKQIANQERLITQITERLQKTTDLSQTLKTTVRDIRHILKVDRVGLFQFDVATNYKVGEFVVEDVATGVFSALATKVQDHCFADDQAENYRQGRYWVVDDVQTLDLPDCLVDLLAQLQVRASLVVPLLKGDILWGLFCIHECRGPRQWQEFEIEFVHRIGAQLNLALKQADYLDQLEEKNAALTATAAREKASKEKLQQQVMQLLMEVRPALEGDLTVRAPVTDTEVGTVASAYNNTLQSLQKIVLEVQQAAAQVGQTSQLSEASVSSLNTEAQQQATSLERALMRVQEMMNFTETVVNDAQRVEVAVQQANQTVQVGDTAMNHTVDGIMAIRSTVADTNQRIKQLSESSQKVSKIVSLISHFTTQTQLLALNASIEATRAGKYGRGFAVVADEVRSLARQSAQAATEIEQLVQEIQVNTAEVSTAMENGIQQVATGTNLVRDARQNLTAIVEVTGQISGLIQGITQTTHQQATEFKEVAVSVTEATEIANQTSHKSEQLTQSIHQLLATAQTLQTSTGKFKVS
ncbi:GAF domain-containing protein [Leptothoe sp. LEGE 181152]|nr:GAF domain-containing protein [Leptothoe sp. LEGE 181152]